MSDMITSGRYRPRRKRSDNPPPLQLTERDIDIVRLIARHRFLTSDHVRALVDGSGKNLTNRLKALFEHRYLDRPECQYDTYRPGGGSKVIAYALADRGARLLSEQPGGKRSYWTHKNKSVGRPFLEHTLAIADFAVRLAASVRERDGVELVDGDELIAGLPAPTQALDKPLRIEVPVILTGTRVAIGLEPDYAFALHLKEAKRKAFFLVEVDRGTMPIERRDIRQTSIVRKLVGYHSFWKQKQFEGAFGWKNFRVLFVTPSAERVGNMIAASEKNMLTRGSPLFLFNDEDTLYSVGDLLARDWRDSNNNEQRLLPKTWSE
jgi:hypothetical protein